MATTTRYDGADGAGTDDYWRVRRALLSERTAALRAWNDAVAANAPGTQSAREAFDRANDALERHDATHPGAPRT